MVDYNKQRKEAIHIVDELVKKGSFTKEDITFIVMRETGFSERFPSKYIGQCVERNIFMINTNGVVAICSKKE